MICLIQERCEPDYDTDEYGCEKYEETLPSTWSLDQDDEQFKLVGSDRKYKCPGGLTPVQAAVIFSENVTMSLSSSLDLIVTDDKLDQVNIDYYLVECMKWGMTTNYLSRFDIIILELEFHKLLCILHRS